jgi:uncharacterized protein (TIGR03435 family)
MRNSLVSMLIAIACVLPSPAPAQSFEAFDVVSIRSNTSGEQGGTNRAQPGRYVGINVTVMRLIGSAYRPIQEFEGGPDWIRTERFDIEAKVDGTPNQQQMLTMLRALLADRFHLVARIEPRQRPVYALTLARRDRRLGPQLRAVTPECAGGPGTCGVRMLDGALTSRGITMARLAAELSFVGRPVVDHSELPGAFDVDLKWTPDTAAQEYLSTACHRSSRQCRNSSD